MNATGQGKARDLWGHGAPAHGRLLGSTVRPAVEGATILPRHTNQSSLASKEHRNATAYNGERSKYVTGLPLLGRQARILLVAGAPLQHCGGWAPPSPPAPRDTEDRPRIHRKPGSLPRG